MALRIAVAGLKHGHVDAMLRAILGHPGASLVGIADDNEENRSRCEQTFGVPTQYSHHRELLDSVSFDVLVVCEEFARRGKVAIDALREAKHVFSDKPLSISEQELWDIAALAGEKEREVGLGVDLCYIWANTGTPIQQGAIGEVVSIAIFGPHALNYGDRPQWYYEPGKHGGIINDLLGHGVDYIHWITGQRATHVLSARRACVGLPQEPEFETFGEAYFQFEDGATAFGHVDYLVPAGHSTTWRCFVVGTEGDATIDERDGMCLRRAGEEEQTFELGAPKPRWEHPLIDFMDFLLDGQQPLRTTDDILRCSMATLVAQRAAETGGTRIAIPEIAKQNGAQQA